jgi:hypothetical protein
MNSPDTVVGCSTCGALYTPAPGDQGLCASCQPFLPDEKPPPSATPRFPASAGKPATGRVLRLSGRAPRPGFGLARALRRTAVLSIATVLVAGLGGAIAFRRQQLAEVWHGVQRGSPAEAWAAVQRLGSEGWSAILRHVPIGAKPVDPPATSDARGTHRRAKVAKK